MTLSLVLQCISTWDFTPVTARLFVCVNGREISHRTKPGGYYLLTDELEFPLTVGISSREYYSAQLQVESPPADRIVSVQLIPRNVPGGGAAWVDVAVSENVDMLVLGFGYFPLARDVKSGDMTIAIRNPHGINLEGRYFVLRDTSSNAEEKVVLGAAVDLRFTEYKTQSMSNSYIARGSAILPAITFSGLSGKTSVALNLPDRKPHPFWAYARLPARCNIECGQRIQL